MKHRITMTRTKQRIVSFAVALAMLLTPVLALAEVRLDIDDGSIGIAESTYTQAGTSGNHENDIIIFSSTAGVDAVTTNTVTIDASTGSTIQVGIENVDF